MLLINFLPILPFSLPYSGYVDRVSGANVDRGSLGYFWSTGANSATDARYLYFNGVDVWPERNTYKTGGFSVRCVKKTISYTFFPFSLPYSGRVNADDGVVNLQGSYGWFWSTHAVSDTQAYSLSIFNTSIWPTGTDVKTRGFPVRCTTKQYSPQHFHSRFRTQAA